MLLSNTDMSSYNKKRELINPIQGSRKIICFKEVLYWTLKDSPYITYISNILYCKKLIRDEHQGGNQCFWDLDFKKSIIICIPDYQRVIVAVFEAKDTKNCSIFLKQRTPKNAFCLLKCTSFNWIGAEDPMLRARALNKVAQPYPIVSNGDISPGQSNRRGQHTRSVMNEPHPGKTMHLRTHYV